MIVRFLGSAFFSVQVFSLCFTLSLYSTWAGKMTLTSGEAATSTDCVSCF